MFTFQFLSSDMVTNVALAKVCALTSGLYVCMLPTFLKNYWTELHEIFRDDLSSSKDRSIRFWERSDQMSRSRSRKGQKLLDRIVMNVLRFSSDSSWNQRPKWFRIFRVIQVKVFWYVKHDMVTSLALSVYRPVCMKPAPKCYQLFSKTIGPVICMTDFQLDKGLSLIPSDQSRLFIYWWAIRSKIKAKVTKGTQKLLDQIAWNFQGWFVIIQGPIS